MKCDSTKDNFKHLSKVFWKCPECTNETIRYDIEKNCFICFNCCLLLSEDEGHKILEGFGEVSSHYFTYD